MCGWSVWRTVLALLCWLGTASCSREPDLAVSLADIASKAPRFATGEMKAKAPLDDPPGVKPAESALPGDGTEQSDPAAIVDPDHPFPMVPTIGARPGFLAVKVVRQALAHADREAFDNTMEREPDRKTQGAWLDEARGRYVAAVSAWEHGDRLLLFDGTGKPVQRVALDSASKLYWADVAGDPTRELVIDLNLSNNCCDLNRWQIFQLNRRGRLRKIGEYWRLHGAEYHDGRELVWHTCFRNALTQPRKGELVITTMEFDEDGCEAADPDFPKALGEKHTWFFDSQRGKFVERRVRKR